MIPTDKQAAAAVRKIEERATEVAERREKAGPAPVLPSTSNDKAHEVLRRRASLPLVQRAVRELTQRLSVIGFAAPGREADAQALWAVWEERHMRGRLRALVEDALVTGAGVLGVWRDDEGGAPTLTVEDPARCWHQPDPHGPGYVWAARAWTRTVERPGGPVDVEMLTWYDAEEVAVLERQGGNAWQLADLGEGVANPAPNPYPGTIPLVQIAVDRDPQGMPRSWSRSLEAPAAANHSLQFDLLLAGHTAAARQLFISGYDPVIRDENGDPVFLKDDNGNPVLDPNGMPVPATHHALTLGPDKITTFTDSNTKLDAVPESNLKNYVEALGHVTNSFAAAATMSPVSFGASMSQISADAIELTMQSQTELVSTMQEVLGEDLERVFELIAMDLGLEPLPAGAALVWKNSATRTLSQIGSFISQTAGAGIDPAFALQMLSGVDEQTAAGAVDTPRTDQVE